MSVHDGASAAETTLKAALELQPAIIAAREEIEGGRRLPMHLVDAMKRAGIFRMPMPRAWGGPELDPMSQLRVLEALAVADASVSWCAMIGCDGGYFTSFIDQGVAREMYSDLDAVTAAAATPTGRALRVKGGYRLSGRWPFASGCQHSTWVVAGCIVHDDSGPKLRANGVPETRQCFLPTAEIEILDTWYTTGLRGSGSHDFTIQDHFVPEERTFSYQDLTFHRPYGLYRFPMNILLKFAGPALGVARAAIDALIGAGEKPARLSVIGGRAQPPRQLRDEEYMQTAVARAEAKLGSARSYLFEATGTLWETLQAGTERSRRIGAQFLLANTNCFSACAEAVQIAYKARGGSAVYANGVLDRCLRDVLTMNEHVGVSLKTYSMAGRLLLGLPPEDLFL